MGAIGSILGTAGGVGGTGISGPEQARIDDAATLSQADELYRRNQAALQQQQGFVQQVLGQNGLQNQSNVYNQLSQVAQGQGPNPAQAMLQQQTGQNAAQQASLMAGQRGASSNVGMIARQAAQQGTNMQQQATGQAAQMQAQQSLNALGTMGNMANQQASQAANAVQGYTGSSQAEQSNILNAIEQQNAARAGVQSSINSANASMANTRMGQQASFMGNMMPGAGQVMQMFAEGGSVSKEVLPASQGPAAAKGPRSKTAQFFSSMGQTKSQDGAGQTGKFVGNLIKEGIKSLFAPSHPVQQSQAPMSNDPYAQYSASGFSPEQMAEDRSRQDAIEAGALPSAQDPSQQLQTSYGHDNESEQMSAANDQNPFMAAKGGKVPAMVSPGEVYLDRKAVKDVEKGKDPIRAGEKIKGKAKVKGDSLKNDTVAKTLESGGIVLPKSVMESKHPHWSAHKFVSAIMAKQGKLPAKKVK